MNSAAAQTLGRRTPARLAEEPRLEEDSKNGRCQRFTSSMGVSKNPGLTFKAKTPHLEASVHLSILQGSPWVPGPASIKLESIISLPLPPALPPGNHCPDFSHQTRTLMLSEVAIYPSSGKDGGSLQTQSQQ